jgi:hypothetical protein
VLKKARQGKGLAVFTMCETPCTCGCPACAGRIPADFGAKVAKNALLFAKTPEEGRALVEFFTGAEGLCTGRFWHKHAGCTLICSCRRVLLP